MFGWHRKKTEERILDPAKEKAVIRVSICTGEKTGCIQDLQTKRRRDVMLIRGEEDLKEFARLTGTDPESIEEVM